MDRIRTLDGWRGIAILLVIAEHAGWEHFEHQTRAAQGKRLTALRSTLISERNASKGMVSK